MAVKGTQAILGLIGLLALTAGVSGNQNDGVGNDYLPIEQVDRAQTYCLDSMQF